MASNGESIVSPTIAAGDGDVERVIFTATRSTTETAEGRGTPRALGYLSGFARSVQTQWHRLKSPPIRSSIPKDESG